MDTRRRQKPLEKKLVLSSITEEITPIKCQCDAEIADDVTVRLHFLESNRIILDLGNRIIRIGKEELIMSLRRHKIAKVRKFLEALVNVKVAEADEEFW